MAFKGDRTLFRRVKSNCCTDFSVAWEATGGVSLGVQGAGPDGLPKGTYSP